MDKAQWVLLRDLHKNTKEAFVNAKKSYTKLYAGLGLTISIAKDDLSTKVLTLTEDDPSGIVNVEKIVFHKDAPQCAVYFNGERRKKMQKTLIELRDEMAEEYVRLIDDTQLVKSIDETVEEEPYSWAFVEGIDNYIYLTK